MRERRKAFQVTIRERLLQEKEVSFPRRCEVTPRRVIREAAIGIGADRHIRPQRPAHRKRGGDLGVERLDADLELEKADALAGLGFCLRNVLVRRRIADQPHGRDLAAQGAAHEIVQRQA